MALADVGVVYRSALVILSEHKPRLTERTQSAVVDDGEQRLGVQAAGAEQLLHLFHGQHSRKPFLPAYLGQGQAGDLWEAHSVLVALQSVDEVLELRDGRQRLAGQQIRQVAVNILLGELLGELPGVGHRLVQRVTESTMVPDDVW